MFKIFFTIIATTSICLSLNAQDNDARDRVNFGVKIGLNLSNVYDSEGEDFVAEGKAGMAFGAFATLPLGKIFAIQPEILLSQKGFQSTGNILGNSYALTRTSTFIDVPILFAFRPVGFCSFLLGPQYSYLARQKDVFGSGSNTVVRDREFSNDNIRDNLLGITGGADINLKNIVFSARLGWDIQNNKNDGSSYTPRYKNVWYQATIGYRFF